MPEERFNPFPGLRSFEPEEEHLFFGREQQIDELLRRLRSARFLAVVGSSGSGKSSLVRSGLIPALYSGYMAPAGSRWRVALMRPGADPVGNLAEALAEPAVVGVGPAGTAMQLPFLESTLRRSSLGLAHSVQHAHIGPDENVLIVVDQFEELFRFKQARATADARDEAVAFVNLLADAARQETAQIYVVLTMRSEFIGQCTQFGGLAAAVNEGLYLVPRMGRDELRRAITGPVAVGGGTITPRLVTRLLNDVGDDPDHLPILQHALMRTWDYWQAHGADGPLDLPHYEAIGTMDNALSQHADEAFAELTEHEQPIAERIFKALVEMTPEAGAVRRPSRVAELGDVANASELEVVAVVDRFRMAGRSFLMPPAVVPLRADTVVDLSHESLVRLWGRLVGWAEDEARAADHYKRLRQAAELHAQAEAGLWTDPQLQLALDWREAYSPTRAWGERIAPGFDLAMAFLEISRAARDETIAERERQVQERRRMRRRQLIAARVAAAVLFLFSIVAGVSLVAAWRARDDALAQRARADQQRQVAVEEARKARTAEEEARRQGAVALQQEQLAMAAQARAERESASAMTAAQTAEEQRMAAQEQRQIADEQRVRAQEQQQAAETARKAAEGSERLAQSSAEAARSAATAARDAEDRAVQEVQLRSRLQSLALSRALAGEATRQLESSAVRALLARESFNLAVANKGDPESPEIVTALRESLESFAPETVRVFIGHNDAVRAIALSPGGTALATAADDGVINLHALNPADAAPLALGASGSPVRALSFDRQGTLLAAGTLDGIVRVWSVEAPPMPAQLLKSWNAHPKAVSYVGFDARSRLITLAADGELKVWQGDAFVQSTGAPTLSHKVLSAALSPSGETLAAGTDGAGVVVIDLTSASKQPVTLAGSQRVTALTFSPDNRWLVAGSASGQLLYWDLARPQAPGREVPAHRAAITSVQFGGGLFASAGLDGDVRVWNGEPEALQRPPLVLRHGAWVWSVAFSESGDRVFSAGADRRVRVWPTRARLLADEVCRRVGRNLDEAEWKRYVIDVPYSPTCPALAVNRSQP